jgi:hypothetical protein
MLKLIAMEMKVAIMAIIFLFAGCNPSRERSDENRAKSPSEIEDSISAVQSQPETTRIPHNPDAEDTSDKE